MGKPESCDAVHTRTAVARAVKFHGDDSPEAAEARRDHRAQKAADVIRDIVASAPPLTVEQVERLRSLLASASVVGVEK
jgi:hypothetical protein